MTKVYDIEQAAKCFERAGKREAQAEEWAKINDKREIERCIKERDEWRKTGNFWLARLGVGPAIL